MMPVTVTAGRLRRPFLQHAPRPWGTPFGHVFPRYRFMSTVGRKVGWRRAWVACSNAYASLISTGS